MSFLQSKSMDLARLLALGPDFVKVKSGNYIIEASGEELLIDLLSEEVAIISFDSIQS